MALDGKIDFLKKTNPWGSGEEGPKGTPAAGEYAETADKPPDLLSRPPNPEFAARKLMDIVKRRQAAASGAKR